QKLFAVRTLSVAVTTTVLAGLLVSPLVNVLAILDGPQWLAAYGVVLALGALSTAIALAITIALFRLVGPKRTRLIAQIVAAIVGAGFVIGLQGAAILYYGKMSRFTILQSAEPVAAAPARASPF
ncbi:MAG: permease, partial [Candidatus Devosia euplotis]|nr:permease [Candidatus Devosia euplotis]